MTKDQKHRYNQFLESLRYIASHTKTIDQAKLYCSKNELDYQEFLETQLKEVKDVATEAVRNRNYMSMSDRSKY